MGLFGGAFNKRQNTTNTTLNEDNRIGADGSVIGTDNATIIVNDLSADVVGQTLEAIIDITEDSVRLSELAVDASTDNLAESLDFVSDLNESTYDFLGGVIESFAEGAEELTEAAFSSQSDILEKNFETIQENSETQSEKSMEKMVTIAIAAILVVGAISYFRK